MSKETQEKIVRAVSTICILVLLMSVTSVGLSMAIMFIESIIIGN